MSCIIQSISTTPPSDEWRCKICYQSELPLVTLCECEGSIGYVHEHCITQWLRLKL